MTNDNVSALLASLTPLVTPFEQALLQGGGRGTDAQLQTERNSYNALNGSGANDPNLAQSSPNGMFDFLYGSPKDRAQKTVQPKYKFALLVLVLGVVGYFVLKRL